MAFIFPISVHIRMHRLFNSGDMLPVSLHRLFLFKPPNARIIYPLTKEPPGCCNSSSTFLSLPLHSDNDFGYRVLA
jgi:hypothetical protein